MTVTTPSTETWPALPYDAWKDTLDTLHMWTQIVGKVKLELAPFLNEWWGIGFTAPARGLTTSTIPFGHRVFQVDFDFLDHRLAVPVDDGSARVLITGVAAADPRILPDRPVAISVDDLGEIGVRLLVLATTAPAD